MTTNDNILALKHITKRFSGVLALDDVSLELRRGEIHALVGENGAGKSTLIKVITGAHLPTFGEWTFDDKEMTNNSPAISKAAGIGVIYQELNLMPQLTVRENIFYGKEIKKGIFLDEKNMYRDCLKMIDDLGVSVDPNALVRDLSIAEQQVVEIVKAISEDIKFLIMDEPTAPLTNTEIDKLFSVVEKLRAKGITILYISHRLEEIFRISDRVTVLRDGRHVITMNTADTDRPMLIKHMVGREIGQEYPKRTTPIGPPVLEVEGYTNAAIHDCSLTLHKGEILGLAGLVGAGRTEFARGIFGADPISRGTMRLNGEIVEIRTPKDAIRHRIGLITEDRKSQGLLINKGIDFNVVYASLKSVSRAGFVQKKKEAATVSRFSEAMHIKAHSSAQLAKTLSGGNQQKVVLAKWLATQCDILIFDEPTRGIDVGAKREIYQLMRDLVSEGKSILMISSEMPELIGMSDRILVMRKGAITGMLSSEDVKQESILELATE